MKNYNRLNKDGDLMIIGDDLLCNTTYKNSENIKADCDPKCKNINQFYEMVMLLSIGMPKLAQSILEILSIRKYEERHF